jgi:hypothetical protein
MGSQWVSEPNKILVRDFVRSGRLGQITKIEQVWNDNNHRWHNPDDPDIKAIREEDTDWIRWLFGKQYHMNHTTTMNHITTPLDSYILFYQST